MKGNKEKHENTMQEEFRLRLKPDKAFKKLFGEGINTL